MTSAEIINKLNLVGIDDIIDDYVYSTEPLHFYFVLYPKVIDAEMINKWKSLPIIEQRLDNIDFKSFSYNEYVVEYDGNIPVKALRTTVKPELTGSIGEVAFNTFISNLLAYLF